MHWKCQWTKNSILQTKLNASIDVFKLAFQFDFITLITNSFLFKLVHCFGYFLVFFSCVFQVFLFYACFIIWPKCHFLAEFVLFSNKIIKEKTNLFWKMLWKKLQNYNFYFDFQLKFMMPLQFITFNFQVEKKKQNGAQRKKNILSSLRLTTIYIVFNIKHINRCI